MNLLMRTDANSYMGTGHVMRCLALAQGWQDYGGRVTFLVNECPTPLETRLQHEKISVEHLQGAAGSKSDADQTIQVAKSLEADWVVVDGYHFDAVYQRALKDAGLRLLFIDDYGHADGYVADLVLNQNINAQQTMYANRGPHTQLLLGTQYALLRREFRQWKDWMREIPDVARRILVTLGGGDPENVTLKVIQAFQTVELSDLEVIAVVGGGNVHHHTLVSAVQNSLVSIDFKQNPTDMPELMAWADVAISGGGSTCWELAFMALPSCTIVLAENQLKVAEMLEREGLTVNIGWFESIDHNQIRETTEAIIRNSHCRLQMSSRGRETVSGEGCKRVLSVMIDHKEALL